VDKIAKLVDELTRLYKTNSPFELCKKLDINVIFIDLPQNTNGLFLKTKDNRKLILINKEVILNNSEKIKNICAHELGHALLHSDKNICCFENNLHLIKELDEESDAFAKALLNTQDSN